MWASPEIKVFAQTRTPNPEAWKRANAGTACFFPGFAPPSWVDGAVDPWSFIPETLGTIDPKGGIPVLWAMFSVALALTTVRLTRLVAFGDEAEGRKGRPTFELWSSQGEPCDASRTSLSDPELVLVAGSTELDEAR